MSQQQETMPPDHQSPMDTEPDFAKSSAPSYPEQFSSGTNSFIIEDSFYRSSHARPVHWSVAWSDLMMTMFILFLTMFVYQSSHEEFLVSDTPEIVGGSTSEAIDVLGDGDIIVPIRPMGLNPPRIASKTAKNVEEVQLNDLDIDAVFSDNVVYVEPDSGSNTDPGTEAPSDPIPGKTSAPTLLNPQTLPSERPIAAADVIEPAPLSTTDEVRSSPPQKTSFQDMYTMGQQALSRDNLDKFASIELVPDRTVRIILTGDLLFHTGQADLSNKARKSLKRLSSVLQDLPYMVNVIGHTDNLPMHSSRFASNWELSVVRASSVARFLISGMGMSPNQFIVSGYGSTRPRRPNINAANRALNRRVEIIISKRLAPAVPITPENIL
jgi:chemotaxis protein MotB